MAFSAQKTTLSYLKLNICSAHSHLTRNWDSQTLLVLRNQALKSFKLTKSITKKWKLFKKKIKLSPLLFCQCLQASLFVYAILWLYYIYLWWFLFSAKKIPNKQKSKTKAFPEKPKLPVCYSSILMWWHFLQFMVLHPATTSTLPFC